MSLRKILVVNRGDSGRAAAVAAVAAVAAKPECLMREAHAGDLAALGSLRV